jgi:hypothetical protein
MLHLNVLSEQCKERPTKEGVYYFKGQVQENCDEAEVYDREGWMHVTISDVPGYEVTYHGNDMCFDLNDYKGLWYGPITVEIK